MNEPPVIYEQEVLELTGFAISTIQNKMRAGDFPRKLFASRKHGRVWDREEVYDCLLNKNTTSQNEGGFVNV